MGWGGDHINRAIAVGVPSRNWPPRHPALPVELVRGGYNTNYNRKFLVVLRQRAAHVRMISVIVALLHSVAIFKLCVFYRHSKV